MRIHDCFHVSLLKPYRKDGEERPPALFIDGVPEYEVEAILAHRQRRYGKGKMKFRCEYFVQWKGYPAEHNSWEPARNLTHCDETLQEYWGRAGLALPPDEDQPDAAADSRTAADNRNTPDTVVVQVVENDQPGSVHSNDRLEWALQSLRRGATSAARPSP